MPYNLPLETDFTASGGLVELIVWMNTQLSGALVPLILLIPIWIGLAFGIYKTQERNTGRGDFSMSSAVASFVVFVLTAILGLNTEGLITTTVGSVVFVVFIATTAWFLFSEKDN